MEKLVLNGHEIKYKVISVNHSPKLQAGMDKLYNEGKMNENELGKDLKKWNINDFQDIFKDLLIEDDKLFWNVLTEQINIFQQKLSTAGFEFGFRVINEILRFMYVCWKYKNKLNPWLKWQRYFDAQIKQKILPKIHGSQRTLGDLLPQLFERCYGAKSETTPRQTTDIEVKAIFKTAALKLAEMDKTLFEQRYVSFTR